jgi:putative phosphoesterase
MRIGILSDSHGRADTTALAVKALRDRGAELLLHLGDIGTREVIDALAGGPARIVFGNCDPDPAALARYAQRLEITVDHPLGIIEIDGKRIALTHGHLPSFMSQALRSGVDYLLHGHTHEIRDERIGPTRVVNPGALFRACRYTAMMLDPARDALTVIEIPHPLRALQ